MSKFKKHLLNQLKSFLSKEELSLLPSGFHRVGHVVILNLKPELLPKKDIIAEKLLETFKWAKTVCIRKAPIKGEMREPQIEYVVGEKNTEVLYREGGCNFKFDVSKLMLSKGNVKERQKLWKLVQENETIVDMFCGFGYWCISIAKFANPKVIYAIDINPVAIKYLKENIKLNKVEGKIIPILGDCREVVKKLGKVANRVIMGYLPKTYRFLSSAFSVLKEEGGVIHYHDIFKKEELFNKPIEILKNAAKENGYVLSQVLRKGIVKSYAPKVYHVVIDARFSRSK